RLARVAQAVPGAGQQHRDGAARGERPRAVVAQPLEMVGGQRREFRGPHARADVRELFGVDLDAEAERTRGGEQAREVVRTERDVFDVNVDRGREARARNLGQRAVDQRGQVV